jgi:peptidyl-prolyl cis-trans isomerase SurA
VSRPRAIVALSVASSVALVVLSSAARAEEKAAGAAKFTFPEGFELIDRVVALVDDQIVTWWEVQRMGTLTRSQPILAAMRAGATDDDADALSALIDESLILQEAKELELKVTDGDVDASIRRIQAAGKMNDEQFAAAVQDMGFTTVRAYREHTKKEILKARTFMYKVGSRVNVGAVDVQRVLDEEYEGGATVPQVRISTILRKTRPDAGAEELAEAERTCKWLQGQAAAAPELFADLVRRYSEDDATRFSQGDVGYVSMGQLEDTALEGELFATSVGGVTRVVRARDGFRIFQVTERRRAPVRDLEDLRNTIYDRLVEKEQERIYTSWLQELRETHFVETRL